MDPGSVVVSLVFGLALGWGISRRVDDPRPLVAALVVGIAVGAVVRIGGIGQDSALIGGWLLLGCTAGLTGCAPALARSGP